MVGLPHEKWGEAPHAFVVRCAGAAATEEELHEVRARAARRVQDAEGRDVSWTSCPKTATGKVQKYVLRGGRAAISRQ